MILIIIIFIIILYNKKNSIYVIKHYGKIKTKENILFQKFINNKCSFYIFNHNMIDWTFCYFSVS